MQQTAGLKALCPALGAENSLGHTKISSWGSGRTLSWRQHLPGGYSSPMESPGVPSTELSLPSSSEEAEQLCFTWKIHPKSRENYAAPCASKVGHSQACSPPAPQHEEEQRGSPDGHQPLCRMILGHPWPQKSPN